MARLCGIGLLLRDNDDYLEVEEVVKDGPSHLSGKVQPSDIVKAVDSVRVGRRHGYALDNVKKLILGLPDTTVTLRVLRSHQEFDVIITRAHPRTSSAANWLGKPKTLVAGATAFTSSPAATPDAAAKPDLRRHSTSLPVQPTGTEQDVRLSGGRYSVQLDYQAKMAHELSLSPGQTVFVTRKHRTGWWEGVLGDGSKGWFPSNVLHPAPLPEADAVSVPTAGAHSGPAPVAPPTDLSKAPGYGAYATHAASSKGAPAAHAAAAPATHTAKPAAAPGISLSALQGERSPGSHSVPAAPGYGAHTGQRGQGRERGTLVGDRGNSTQGDGGGPVRDARIPAALAEETILLLRELRLAASQLRRSHRRQRVRRADNPPSAASAGGSSDADLSAEATVASLHAQLAAQAREAEAQSDLCARLERDKAAAEQRCRDVEEELLACAAERNRALEELDTIKQDPDLYFAGLATGDGRGGGGGGGGGGGRGGGGALKRRSGASMASSGDDVDFDEEDVDFESHAQKGVART